MDGCSWLLFQSHGDGTASEGSGLVEEQDVAISSQLQQQLKQIYMLLDAEEHGHVAPAPSSSESTFRSFTGSPNEDSSPMLTGTSTMTTTSCHHQPEVSSLQIPLSPIAYGDHHNGLCYANLDTIPNLDDLVSQEAHQEQAQRQNVHGASGAFRPYIRHLTPRKKPKPGSYGQRSIKAAMSVLARMHMAKLAHWQSYQMEMPAETSAGSNCNQLQHVLSERKRREKLNDSFKSLRAVLPSGPKKDKASILIRARDYVNTLKSRVSELEEKSRMLEESKLHSNDGGRQDNCSGENIEVDISRSAAEEFHLKIDVGSGWNAMDVVVGTLQCLNEIGDVRLVAMDKGSSSGLNPGKNFQRATITLQIKSSRCDEDFLKESVMKTIKGVTQSKIATTQPSMTMQ